MTGEMWPLFGSGGPSREEEIERQAERLCVCVCVVHMLASMTCPFNRWGSGEMAGGARRPRRAGSGEITLSLSPNNLEAAWQLAAANTHTPTPHILVYMQRDS